MHTAFLLHSLFSSPIFLQVLWHYMLVNADDTVQRPKRQIGHTCTVYDETAASQSLLDDASGNPCTLFPLSHFNLPTEDYVVTTKIIATGTPLAQYLTIQPRNFTIVTSKRVDREQICAQVVSEGTTTSSVDEGMQRCCTASKRDCEIPLTVLVQFKRVVTEAANQTMGERQAQFVRLHLRLIDVNDNAPRFQSGRHQIFISEAVNVGTRIQVPLAQDADSDEYGIVRYYLESQEDDTFELVQVAPVGAIISPMSPITNDVISSVLLAVNQGQYPLSDPSAYFSEPNYVNSAPAQLYLKLLKPLDWETKRLYKFILVAEDNGTPPLTGKLELQVAVTDENDNHPVFANKTFTISVPENTSKGRRLLQLIAHDPDDGKAGVIVYSLADNVMDRYMQPFKTQSTAFDNHSLMQHPNVTRLFQIDPHTGWLSLNGKLDYERTKHHLLRVLARDDAGHPGFDEATVNVIVLDVNDAAPSITVEPVIELNDQHQRWRKPSDSTSLELYVKEVSGMGNNIQSRFLVDGYPRQHAHANPLLAFVMVRDPDTGNGGVFQCGLQQGRKPGPSTNEAHTFIGEDASQIFAVPLTNNRQHQMPAVSGSFRLNPISKSQFELTTMRGFDHEQQALEQVLIVCSDFGEPSLSSTHTVNVHVEDVNDNAPQFSQPLFQLTIEENKPPDTAIQRLLASDRDTGKNAEIEYILDATGVEYFRIDPVDGTLYTRISFDREVRQNYRFQVLARDHGDPESMTGTAAVEVSVLDVNDNDPEFIGLDHEKCYKFRIAENEPIGTHVGILLGSDIDAHENAQLRFRLITSTNLFKLGSSTGELTTAQLLDRERQPQYELAVMIMDLGRPPRSATTRIVIHVTDLNDNDPIIVFPANGRGNVTVSFREPPGEVVARVEARDPDEGHNALLHYSLITGNRNAAFRMGSTTAELMVDRELDESDLGSYILDILVQDAGVPPRSAQVQLTVVVTDTPARMYSHRFAGTHGKYADSETQTNLAAPTSAGSYRRPDGTALRLDNRELRPSEINSSDSGIVSAGAILVAIVALSCAIILVLLGIAVYLCGRRGFRLSRMCRIHMSRLSNMGSSRLDSGLQKPGKLIPVCGDPNQHKNQPPAYTEQLVIDTGGVGTLLRCPFGSVSPAPPVLKDPDYTEQTLLRRTTPINYDGYTTCMPVQERIPVNSTYDTFSTPRFWIPYDKTHLQEVTKFPTSNNAVVLGSNIKTGYPIKLCTRNQTSESGTVRRHCGNRVFVGAFSQSLKAHKATNGPSATDSPISDGSAIISGECKHGNQQHSKVRTVRSCESLLTLRDSDNQIKLPMPQSSEHRNSSRSQVQLDGLLNFSDEHLRAPHNQLSEIHYPMQQPGMTMSTFLPRTRLTPKSQRNAHDHCITDGQMNTMHASPIHKSVLPKSFNYPVVDRQGYSCLLACGNTDNLHDNNDIQMNLTMTEHPDLSTSPCFDPLCTAQSRKSTALLPPQETANLIDLMDSCTNSTCSQSCVCNMLPEHVHLLQSGKSWSLGEQAEFV